MTAASGNTAGVTFPPHSDRDVARSGCDIFFTSPPVGYLRSGRTLHYKTGRTGVLRKAGAEI